MSLVDCLSVSGSSNSNDEGSNNIQLALDEMVSKKAELISQINKDMMTAMKNQVTFPFSLVRVIVIKEAASPHSLHNHGLSIL